MICHDIGFEHSRTLSNIIQCALSPFLYFSFYTDTNFRKLIYVYIIIISKRLTIFWVEREFFILLRINYNQFIVYFPTYWKNAISTRHRITIVSRLFLFPRQYLSASSATFSLDWIHKYSSRLPIENVFVPCKQKIGAARRKTRERRTRVSPFSLLFGGSRAHTEMRHYHNNW